MFQSVQQGGTKVKTLFTLKNCNFANSVIFAILDSLDFSISCHFGFFTTLVPLCKFYKTNTDFEKLWFLPET